MVMIESPIGVVFILEGEEFLEEALKLVRKGGKFPNNYLGVDYLEVLKTINCSPENLGKFVKFYNKKLLNATLLAN